MLRAKHLIFRKNPVTKQLMPLTPDGVEDITPLAANVLNGLVGGPLPPRLFIKEVPKQRLPAGPAGCRSPGGVPGQNHLARAAHAGADVWALSGPRIGEVNLSRR
jgi:hypothetical protein